MKIKKQKTQKNISKKKLKFENYKNCLEPTQLENKINYLEINNTNIDSIKKYHKQFIRNNKSLSKTQQRFKSKRYNVFTEEINKIALSSNDSKRMQLIDSIETYAYGRSKVLVSEKEVIKCNNIIKHMYE